MTLYSKRLKRLVASAAVAALPIALAGCSFLFPQQAVKSGASVLSATPAPAARASTGSAAPAAAAVAAVAAAPAKMMATSTKAQPTLYARLGGDAGMNAFTDDFLGRVTNDPLIIPFFKGLTDADLKRIRQHVFELLCSATGGPCTYTGKDMKTTHKDMEINNDSWNAFTGHLNETVARFGIQDRERNELVVIIASLKHEIVNR